MAKNILIFSDGTGQVGGIKPDQHLSNIYKLYRATRTGVESPINPAEQIAFYDPGLGTPEDVGSSLFGFLGFLKRLLASATGRGITKNITDCYEALLNLYEPGDRIYLFGFSRGAYTARSVAGVLALCGIPTVSRSGQPLPRYCPETRAIADEAVRKVYEHGAGFPLDRYEAERNELARRFRSKYQSEIDGHGNVDAYFIGVFDTVASLGSKGFVRFGIAASLLVIAILVGSIVAYVFQALFGWSWVVAFGVPATIGLIWFAYLTFRSAFKYIRHFPHRGNYRCHIAKWNMANYNRGLSARVRYARHALSIDETRADFPRVQWGFKNVKPERADGEPEYLQQIWFAGNHSDVGGSYPEEESRLSDISLQWMVEQAQSLPHPLLVDGTRLRLFPDAAGLQHCEVEALRSRYPKWFPPWAKFTWAEKPRKEAMGAPLHPSVLERLALSQVPKCGQSSAYRPSVLKGDPKLASYYGDG